MLVADVSRLSTIQLLFDPLELTLGVGHVRADIRLSCILGVWHKAQVPRHVESGEWSNETKFFDKLFTWLERPEVIDAKLLTKCVTPITFGVDRVHFSIDP